MRASQSVANSPADDLAANLSKSAPRF